MKAGMRAFRLMVLGFAFVYCIGCTSTIKKPATQSIKDLVHNRQSEVFSLPFESYRELDESLPIGVFDSGIGGLTVLNQIVTIDRFDNETHRPGADGRPDFEKESFIYLGDQANMPYGNYPSEDKISFLKELILKDVVFLLGNRYWPTKASLTPRTDKPPVKAVVIACNTATAYGLDDILEALKRWNISVFTVGVVAAGADGAVELLEERETPGAVAVLATVGTCKSEGYVREVQRSSRNAGLEAPTVVQQGCLGLAGAIEGSPEYVVAPDSERTATYRGPAVDNLNAPLDSTLVSAYGFDSEGIIGDPEDPGTWHLNSVDNYIQYHTTTLLENYREEGSSEPITTVILGCTHFPFYQETIEASFNRLRAVTGKDGRAVYENLIAEEVDFVDPAVLTAVQLYEALDARQLLNATETSTVDEFYISVPNTTCPGVELRPDGLSFVYDYKYGRSPGELEKEYVKRVPMNRDNLGTNALDSIRTTMPTVWGRLVAFSAHSPRCSELPRTARLGISAE